MIPRTTKGPLFPPEGGPAVGSDYARKGRARGALDSTRRQNWGASVVVTPGQTADIVKNWGLPEVVENDPSADQVIVTLSKRREGTSGVIAAARAFCRCLLEWGAGGTTHSAIVDYVQGTTISLHASALSISAAYEPGSGPAYRCHATISYGSGAVVPFGAAASFTSPYVTLADLGPFTPVRVPPFAKAYFVVTADALVKTSGTSLVLSRQRNDFSTLTLAADLPLQPFAPPLPTQIVEGCDYLELQYQAGAGGPPAADFAVLFELAL